MVGLHPETLPAALRILARTGLTADSGRRRATCGGEVTHPRVGSLLAATPEISFTEMRDHLGMTDGNLITHIKHLQKAGYIGVTKSFRGKRQLTTLSLTDPGRKAFADYINALEQIVKNARSQE